MLRYFLLLFILIKYVNADTASLDSLLTQYNQETERFKHTKKDAAGDFSVFTREDLDRMHVRQLSDILNLLKSFNMTTARIGVNQLNISSTPSFAITPLKLFINAHEISNATFGNPIGQYGDMDLSFIDYIEVYEAGNSVSFGSESGTVVVRLFTKKPSRESGEFVKTELSSRGSIMTNVLSAHLFQDSPYSYLINANFKKSNAKEYDVNGFTLHNDTTKGQIFFQFQKENDYTIELGILKNAKDPFAHLSMSSTYAHINGDSAYIHLNKKLPADMTLRLCTTYEKVSEQTTDAVGIKLSNGLRPKNLDTAFHTLTSKATLEKVIDSSKNHLFMATQLEHSTLSVDRYNADATSINVISGPTTRNLFSLYGEDQYNLDAHNSFVVGLKYNVDSTTRKFNANESELLYRIGHIGYFHKLTNKLFVLNRSIDPSFSQSTFSPVKVRANPYLKDAQMSLISDDAIYKLQEATTLKAGLTWVRTKNSIGISPLLHQYVNNPKDLTIKRPYLGVEHHFNVDTKLQFEVYKLLMQETHTSPNSGGYLQFFSKIGKLDIYNELVYRASYTNEVNQHFHAGYDYSFALSYPMSRKLDITLKGQNIFNSASRSSIYEVDASNKITSTISVPSREQEFFLSLEYTF